MAQCHPHGHSLGMERNWVVLMFIGCMSHRIPFGKDQVLKDLFSETRTPINIASNMYHLSSTPLKLPKCITKSLILTCCFSREVSGPGEKESTASRVGIEPFLHNWLMLYDKRSPFLDARRMCGLLGEDEMNV